MDELDAGRQKFLELVHAIDSGVEIVIPTAPSNGVFLISLTKGPNRRFITVSEDDVLDLPNESEIREKVTKTVTGAVAAL